VHDLGQRDELVARVRPLGEVRDGALLDPLGHVRVAGRDGADAAAVALVGDLVHRRHVHALDPRELTEHALAAALGAARGLPSGDHLGDLGDDLFAVAQHDEVEEVGERLGVVGAVPARGHQRVLGAALGGPHRHARQIDAVEEVGVGQLGGQVEGEHVELVARAVSVDREQRDALAPHDGLEIAPRCVRALGDGVVTLVQDLVEDLQALVGQTDLVGVGIRQQPGNSALTCAGTASPRPRDGVRVASRQMTCRPKGSGTPLRVPNPAIGRRPRPLVNAT
jgi:hypothetical protein